MIRIFVTLFTLNFYCETFLIAAETKQSIFSIFEGLGYSPACVASALATCEQSTNTSKSYASPSTELAKERPRNCQEILSQGDHTSGVRIVYPYNCCRDQPVVVLCDQTTDGGGWTVFQNRDALPTREDFYRTWVEYVLGFGNVTGEFWLGLDNLHAIVSSTLNELRVDLEDYEGEKRYAKYGLFYVGDSTSKYLLSVGRYSGDAGDGLVESNGMLFSTCESHVNNSKTFTNYLSDAAKERPRNCQEILSEGDHTSGVKTVYPYNCCRDQPVVVFCDQTTDGGGWTVFQNRDALPTREDFYRTWVEYVLGFGNVTGEFWLGLDNLHALVSSTLNELRVDLEDYEGEKRYAKYGLFYVGDSTSKYLLSVGRYLGDAGDSMSDGANGMKFSTLDQDNDISDDVNCAVSYRGAWWYDKCHASNLNGYQHVVAHTSYADGINWYHFRQHNYSLKKSSMKVRPAFL